MYLFIYKFIGVVENSFEISLIVKIVLRFLKNMNFIKVLFYYRWTVIVDFQLKMLNNRQNI